MSASLHKKDDSSRNRDAFPCMKDAFRALAVALLLLAGCVRPEVPPVPSDPPVPEVPDEQEQEEKVTSGVWGHVTCDGRGVEGVVVSDGYAVTQTDDAGRYVLDSKKRNGYVFISTPGGYDVPQNGILPEFWHSTTREASEPEKIDFTLSRSDQERHTVLMLGDMHLANRMSDFAQFRDFAADVRRLMREQDGRNVYAITLGDMSWDIFWYRYGLEDYLVEMNQDFGSELPVFHTIGNHDHDPAMTGDFLTAHRYWKVLGPSWYSFNIGRVHYIVLDDIRCANTADARAFSSIITDEQLAWLARDLSYVPKETPIVLTMHSPLYYDNGNLSLKNSFSSFLKLFEGRSRLQVFTGHTHVVFNVDRMSSSVKVFECNSGAVCGAWWMTGHNVGVHLGSDGAPGGYKVLDVNGSSMSWYFKATGQPSTKQFRTYDRNEIELSAEKWAPHASASGKAAFETAAGEYAHADKNNYVLINVWDYDPSWTITVTENGNRLPVERLEDVKDPLYLVCYEAYEYEHHYDDSVYYPASKTKHIFRVQASSPSSTLQISVKDRLGRIYTETMTRPKPFVVEP